MITITPPLPLTSISPENLHLPIYHQPGRLGPTVLVFHLEERDGARVATGLVPAPVADDDILGVVPELRILLLQYEQGHTFSGSVTLEDADGDPAMITVSDGQVVADW